MSSGGGEKTESPTPKKLREARREGQIPRTQELGAWAAMLAASMLLPLTIRLATARCREVFAALDHVIADPDPGQALTVFSTALTGAAMAVAPLAFALMGIGLLASALQGGVYPSAKPLKPKASRLNPFPGLKRGFGPQGLWEAAKAVAKSVVLGVLVWRAIDRLVPVLVGSGALPLAEVLRVVWAASIGLMREISAAGLVIAALDYGIVRRRIGKQLKMTKDEVKREHKQTEGDPHLKGAIRSRQLAMSRNRMMAEIADADLVLVNPTHVAVALAYDPEKGAPRVVAKGSGHVAAKIREKATEHRVPMVEDKPLARALHQACDLGQEIPPAFYTAVARVLAFVLSLKAKGSAAGLHRPPPLVAQAVADVTPEVGSTRRRLRR